MSDIKWFKTVFLKWLKRGKDINTSFTHFFVTMFRLNKRTIDTIKCVKDVELRGALWVDSKPIEGLINRRVLNMRVGQVAWIRNDTDETFITLENSKGCVNIKKDVWNARFKEYFSSGHRD